jgi:hypothetical protein
MTKSADMLRALADQALEPKRENGAPGRQRRLPPLNLFRAFEAASRHRSFTLAAEELLVTQSAVSQQIRQLDLRAR